MEPVLFGKYLLCERLAEGGMAVVYRAKLSGPGGFEKTLVVKQIRAELVARPEFVELFVKEAKTTVQLTHANIVPVFELGMVDGTYFLALELVDGPPLAKLIERGALPPPLAAYVAEQILRGLDYAHRREIVHRDLSPANVLCSRDGEVKILDFGIAAEVRGRAVVGGSRGYVAPEQEAGGHVDARSDLYAVGVLMWEMLAGRRHGEGMPKDAPAALANVIERALAPHPDHRWESAEAMLQPVTRYLRDAEQTTQADLARLVRQRAPDVVVTARPQDSVERAVITGPSTAPMRRNRPHDPSSISSSTPALGTRSFGREVTFATRFVEAENSVEILIEPAPPEVEVAPPPRVASDAGLEAGARANDATRRTPTALIAAGAVLLVAISVLAGAGLRDAVGTSPPPSVRPALLPASLTVALDPLDAVLAIDGSPAASMARDATGGVLLAPGEHVLSATAESRAPLESKVELLAGEHRALSIKLPPELGHLEMSSDPPGADVRLDDRALGTTPKTADVPLDAPHKLRFEHRDFAAAERTVAPADFTGGPPRSLVVTQRLEPLARGQLTLGARPWAHVTIDGERRPDTPILRLSLSAGAHAVKLACPATGKELKLSVQIEPNKEIRRVADLTGEPHLIEQ